MTDIDRELSPAESLKAIQVAKARVGDGFSRHTWSYDVVYSSLVGAMVAGWGLSLPIALSIEGVCVAGLILLARGWANRHGVWISGVTPPKARWIAIVLAVAILALLLANLAITRSGDALPVIVKTWVPLAVGIAAALLALRGSRLWRQVYRREMGLDD